MTVPILGALLIILMLVSLFIMISKKERYLSSEKQNHETEMKKGQQVIAAAALPAPVQRAVTLLGEARPYATVTLYAKVSGYIKEIRVDKGDRVRSGQVLAVIESPEIDRQVDAALADAKIKRQDAIRAARLFPEKGISEQDVQRAEAAAQVSESTAASIMSQKEYEVLKAPFDSHVTARYADPGALVQAAVTAQTTVLPVLQLSQTDRLRVYIYLDQKNASLVRVGDKTEITDMNRPSVKLRGKVSRTSRELDLRTRTLLTEVDLDNKDGLIIPSSFVQVTLWIRTSARAQVPAPALSIRTGKSHLAVVDGGNRVRIRPIVIAESDGKNVLVSEGISPGERVVISPGIELQDGDLVRPVAPPG